MKFFPKLYFFSHEKIDLLDLLPCQLMRYIPPEQMTTVGSFSLPQKTDKIFSQLFWVVSHMYITNWKITPVLKSGKVNVPSTFGEASLSVNTVLDKGTNVWQTWILFYCGEYGSLHSTIYSKIQCHTKQLMEKFHPTGFYEKKISLTFSLNIWK